MEEREILTRITNDVLSIGEYIKNTLKGEIRTLVPKGQKGGESVRKLEGERMQGFTVMFYLTDLMPVASISIQVRINSLGIPGGSGIRKLFGRNKEEIRLILQIDFNHTPIQHGYNRVMENMLLEKDFDPKTYTKHTIQEQVGREIVSWALSIIKSNEQTLRPIIYKQR